MSSKRTLLCTACVAAMLAITVSGVRAQGPASQAKPPAYYISEFELIDAEGIRPYSAAVESTFAPFGGRYAARGGKVVSLEGEPQQARHHECVPEPGASPSLVRLSSLSGNHAHSPPVGQVARVHHGRRSELDLALTDLPRPPPVQGGPTSRVAVGCTRVI